MKISHQRGSYAVVRTSLKDAIQSLPADSIILTDNHVHSAVESELQGGKCIVLPAGEETKSLHWFGFCLSELAHLNASRKTTLVAMGGGVIGDLVGFVAASYMRGVPFIQIPTTLLAQVDSSVGGKVGIDLPEGKNLAGAFYAPEEVKLCHEVLRSLPPRQFTNGMAEVLKYGFIMDADLLPRLHGLNVESTNLMDIVSRCIEHKAQVVSEDEFETTGRRAILNFGHTVGHALEKITHYSDFLHGEAISIGMVVEARLGESIGISPQGTTAFVREELASQGLPVTSDLLSSADSLVEAMRRDKKATSGKLAFSLLTQIGECKLVSDVPEHEVLSALSSS